MLIAKVVGDVIASQKVGALVGHKLLLVQPLDPRGAARGNPFVASDGVGAGSGEWVLVCQGSSARMTPVSEGKPVDAVVIGIVDAVQFEGEQVFTKS